MVEGLKVVTEVVPVQIHNGSAHADTIHFFLAA